MGRSPQKRMAGSIFFNQQRHEKDVRDARGDLVEAEHLFNFWPQGELGVQRLQSKRKLNQALHLPVGTAPQEDSGGDEQGHEHARKGRKPSRCGVIADQAFRSVCREVP